MNLSHFSTQRQIAALRIDTIKGSMKGYHKAHELKSKSPGVFSSRPTSKDNTSFTQVTSNSSQRSVSNRNLTPTHLIAGNHNQPQTAEWFKLDRYSHSSKPQDNQLDGIRKAPCNFGKACGAGGYQMGREWVSRRFIHNQGSAKRDNSRKGYHLEATIPSQESLRNPYGKSAFALKVSKFFDNPLSSICEDLGVAYLGL